MATHLEPASSARDVHSAGPPSAPPARRCSLLNWGLIVALGAAIWLVGSWQSGWSAPDTGWRLLAVFLPTILALMLRPIPGGAAVLLGVIATVLSGALNLQDALSGYSSPNVWLVLAAYFMSRAFLNTGLARRIALGFVRLLGGTTLGLGYALVATDTVLAGMIPSNAARVGGVILPVTHSLAERFRSLPAGAAAGVNTFLMLSLYQSDVLACALFLTGQSSNPLAADLAAELTGGQVVLGYGSWFLYALLPASLTLLLAPFLVHRLCCPEGVNTSAVVELARDELARMGPLSRAEAVLAVVFVAVVAGWVLLGGKAGVLAAIAGKAVADGVVKHLGSPTAVVALVGVAVLLLSGILPWRDAVSETAAWDVFLWYGGLVMLSTRLSETGLLRQLAEGVVGVGGGWHWLPLLVVALLVYFYAHYGFASITAHVVAMFPAFVPVLLSAGAPPGLVVCAFAFFANFAAGLTHYGTTPGPIIFSLGHVAQGTWWRVGFLLSLVNLSVWLTAGLAWWKLLGLW